MKKLKIYLLFAFIFIMNVVQSQTTIPISMENFENGGSSCALNVAGPGSNSGSNKWIINNSYNGMVVYPNTPDQSQTNGGTISYAPNSHYLHIEDENGGITNCNYNPTASSDRFVAITGNSTVCTLGMTDITLTFFWIGNGSSPTAYAQLYYSIDNVSWIPLPKKYYASQNTIWQYEIVTDQAFNNQKNVRFGFRWVNDAGSAPGKMSFGVDDIYITGKFDNASVNFGLTLDSVVPNPVCQNSGIVIYYHLSTPLCGQGLFEIQLSDANGNFGSPLSLVIWQRSNEVMKGFLTATVPSTALGLCYKVRIKYINNYYGLILYSNASGCFEIKFCPNWISPPEQPAVTKENPDSVCVNSVIIMSFNSTGVFQPNNSYYAELSDSDGVFSSNLNVLGSKQDSKAYPSMPKGSVSGKITEKNQGIPDGCKYYIRICSTNPAVCGDPWGPFCIKNCDIETNDQKNIKCCITLTQGCQERVHVNVHMYDTLHNSDTSAIYAPTNNFMLETRDMKFFKRVGILGSLGTINNATNDCYIDLNIPPGPQFSTMDGGAYAPGCGTWYLRAVADQSDHMWDVKGTVVLLSVGYCVDTASILQYPADSTLCIGDVVYFYPNPNHSGPPWNSTYEWFINGNLFSDQPAIGVIFNGAGTYSVSMRETNNGCVCPPIPNKSKFYVKGPPTTNITGPLQACLGDTIHYKVPFEKSCYYEWTTSGGTVIDTANNELDIRFDTEGVYTINILAVNECGQAVGKRTVIVTKHPDASFSLETSPVCSGDSVKVEYTGVSTPPLVYKWNFNGGIGVPGGNNPGPHDVSWSTGGLRYVKLTVSKNGCPTSDSILVDVKQTPNPKFNIPNQCLGNPTEFEDKSDYSPNKWYWDFGDKSAISKESNPKHTYSDTGDYEVIMVVEDSINGCVDSLKKTIHIYPIPTSDFLAESPVCPGGTSTIEYIGSASDSANYMWNFHSAEIVSGTTGIGPYEIKWDKLGDYSVELVVEEHGCTSTVTKNPVKMSECVVVVPNVITPSNKDGANDVFVIKGLDLYPNSRLMIFNRWGNKIYENEDYQNDWGKDKSLVDGVYYWVLYMRDGTSMNGTVTIIGK